jgi:hypothetical protein
MISKSLVAFVALVFSAYASSVVADPFITNVVETGGDNEATDTITAKWTGTTFNVSVAGEPVPGAIVGTPYAVGPFGHFSPAFVDRNHRYVNASFPGDTPLVPLPPYLVGGEYIMSGNDNRDNNSYRLDVTLSPLVQEAVVYMLIDNRLLDTNNADPPTFGPANMQWILDQGWIPVATGNNRFGDINRPDEVGIDESADGTINQWFSVYGLAVSGTFSLFQANNAGQNMYGVVVVPTIVVPEPGTCALAFLGVLGVLAARRLRRR